MFGWSSVVSSLGFDIVHSFVVYPVDFTVERVSGFVSPIDNRRADLLAFRSSTWDAGAMRDLTTDDLGLLLSVFAVLLIAFGIDFHFSTKAADRHRRARWFFGMTTLVGELMTALALVLTWVALWSPAAWEAIDDLLVFIPGSIAILCAVILTVDKIAARLERLQRSDRTG